MSPSFAGAKLSGASFRSARFTTPWFAAAELEGADFTQAAIDNGLFPGADLRGARFLAASARWIDLSHARVEGADFSGADLSGANLHAIVGDARWTHCVLTHVRRTNPQLLEAETWKRSPTRKDA